MLDCQKCSVTYFFRFFFKLAKGELELTMASRGPSHLHSNATFEYHRRQFVVAVVGIGFQYNAIVNLIIGTTVQYPIHAVLWLFQLSV